MTDGIIKGSGNSRYLKSVANALALYPTHESLMEAMAAGTFPIDLNGINPAGWNTVGDKLDKATLLTDSLCTALGLSTSATPTQAMDKLRQLVHTAQSTADGRCKIASGSYTGTGENIKQVYLPFTAQLFVVSMYALTYNTTYGNEDYIYIGCIFNGFNSGFNLTFVESRDLTSDVMDANINGSIVTISGANLSSSSQYFKTGPYRYVAIG